MTAKEMTKQKLNTLLFHENIFFPQFPLHFIQFHFPSHIPSCTNLLWTAYFTDTHVKKVCNISSVISFIHSHSWNFWASYLGAIEKQSSKPGMFILCWWLPYKMVSRKWLSSRKSKRKLDRSCHFWLFTWTVNQPVWSCTDVYVQNGILRMGKAMTGMQLGLTMLWWAYN